MNVEVQFGGTYKLCHVTGPGVCKVCHEEITRAMTPAGKFVPLQPEEIDGVWEPHFGHCMSQSRSRPVPEPSRVVGIQITETIWKQLLRLIHPDRHHGGENEKLATGLTQWLLEQRSRLSQN